MKNLGKYTFITVVSLFVFITLYMFLTNKNKESKSIENDLKTEYSKTLNLAICNFDTINPLLSKNKHVIQISNLIFDSLIGVDENYKIEYKIAKESAKINKNIYLIKLNDDIKWQDGEELTAKDIEFTINELKNLDSIYAENVKYIENIEIIDKYTIKIYLNKIINFFEYYLTFPILPYHLYENDKLETSSKLPLGTGEYKIDKIDTEVIKLVKNEYFTIKTREKSTIEEINIYLYKDVKEIYNSFKLGNIDIIHANGSLYKNYIEKIGYNTKEFKGKEYDFISLNCNSSLLSQKELRQALTYAIDKTKVVSEVYGNNAYVADFPLDFGSFAYEKGKNQKYDIEESKKILESLNWKNQNNRWEKIDSNGRLNILSFELIVQSSNSARIKVSEKIKEQLEQIGIFIKIKQVSDNQYNKILQEKNYEMILTGIDNGFSPELQYFYGEENLAQYNNNEVKNILEDVTNNTDINFIREKYKRLIEVVENDYIYIGISRNKEVLNLKPNIGGEFNPNNYNIFYKLDTWHIVTVQ